ncbi:MAG: hypothetical protein KA116_00690 [Proteobacteria bacterium]|nr:hypothetical protein [Pseudomonadota bacterium]
MQKNCVLTLFLAACSYKAQKAQIPISLDSTKRISFVELRETIFRANCVSCHSAYVNYASVKADLSAIEAAVYSGRMPKGKTALSAALQSDLRSWALAGAPEFLDGILPPASTPGGKLPPPEDGANPPDRLSFANLKKQIFEPFCMGCHSQFESYSNVKSQVDKIEVAISSNRMPKGGAPLSMELKDLLLEWKNAGTPEGSGEVPKPPEPLVPTYTSIRKNIFAAKCILCHSVKDPSGGIALDNYQAIVDSELIDRRRPSRSEIYEVLEEGEMPPQGRGIEATTGEERSVILEWIRRGAPE